MYLKNLLVIFVFLAIRSIFAMETSEDPIVKTVEPFYLSVDSDDESYVKDYSLKERYKKNFENKKHDIKVFDLRSIKLPLSALCVDKLLDLTESSKLTELVSTIDPLAKLVMLVDSLKRVTYQNEHLVRRLVRLVVDSKYAPSCERLDKNLCEAAFVGHEYGVRLLLSKGARLNNRTAKALEYASRKGHTGVVKLLLELDDHDLDLKDRDWVISYSLTRARNAEIVKMLVDQGGEIADSNCKGSNCLATAVYKCDIDLIDFLLATMGASPFYGEHGSETTPVAAAMDVMDKRPNEAKIILKKFIAYETPNKTSVLASVLESGSGMGSDEGMKETALALFEEGIDVNAKVVSEGRAEGVTALHIAADAGYSEVVALLLEHGADITIRDVTGVTPLMIATTNFIKSEREMRDFVADYKRHGIANQGAENWLNHQLGKSRSYKRIYDLLRNSEARICRSALNLVTEKKFKGLLA